MFTVSFPWPEGIGLVCRQVRTEGLAISAAALGMTALVAVAGCTRTSDGSIVMAQPSFGGSILSFGGNEEVRVVPSQTIRPPAVQPKPTSVRRAEPRVPKVTIPSMSIAKNPPFKGIQPDKPLSCRNETTSTGRIRVVCT